MQEPLYTAPPVLDVRLREALEIGRDAAVEVLNETTNRYTSPDGTVRDFRGRITSAREDVAKIEAAIAALALSEAGVRSTPAGLTDAERVDWLLHHVAGREWRRLCVEYGANCSRDDLDRAILNTEKDTK